jgi:putative component of toxin-antitoxin plasmid stabilization module
MIRIFRAEEYIEWFEQQTEKSKVQIDDRLSKIQNHEHFGDHRYVGEASAEVWVTEM